MAWEVQPKYGRSVMVGHGVMVRGSNLFRRELNRPPTVGVLYALCESSLLLAEQYSSRRDIPRSAIARSVLKSSNRLIIREFPGTSPRTRPSLTGDILYLR